MKWMMVRTCEWHATISYIIHALYVLYIIDGCVMSSIYDTSQNDDEPQLLAEGIQP